MFVNVDEHFVKAERANEEIFLKCDMHPFTYAVHSVCSLWFKLLKLTGSKQNWDNDLKRARQMECTQVDTWFKSVNRCQYKWDTRSFYN